jgi:hypothetical protein
MCSCSFYLIHAKICICEVSEVCDVCFSCQYIMSGKTGWSSFPNRMFWFAKPDCSILADRIYVTLGLIFVNLLSCASHITCSHILLLHSWIRRYRGAILDFLEKCAKWLYRPKIEFHSIFTY